LAATIPPLVLLLDFAYALLQVLEAAERGRRAWKVAEATISCSMWQTALIRNIPRTAKTI